MFLCKLLPGAVLIGLLSAAACVPACSSDNTANQSNPLSAGVVREGQTTNPALDAFLAAFLAGMTDKWGWAGGTFDTPADGAVLPAATPATFAWHADPTSGPNPNDTIVPSKQNGQAFMLVFSSSSDPKLLRVFTSLTSYTPDAKAWQKLVAAGGPISLNVTSATFENDLLTSDGGPHIGQTISITLQ